MNLVKRLASCIITLTMVFSVVYAQPSDSKSAAAHKSNFSLSELSMKQKIGGGIGLGLFVGISGGSIICKIVNDYREVHRVGLLGYDTSNWKNRYNLLILDETITPQAYNQLYVRVAVDWRFLNLKEWENTLHTDNETAVLFDKKFINRVMERRCAHLQQCVYYIKLYESEIRKHIKESGCDENKVWYPQAVTEFDRFIDELVKVLSSRPAAIPDFKFSDELCNRAWANIKEHQNYIRGFHTIIEGASNEKLMLVSDENTDRVLAMFETLAMDADRLQFILELFGAAVGLDPTHPSVQNAYTVCENNLEKYHALISSSKLSNPYRTLYTYKKSLV